MIDPKERQKLNALRSIYSVPDNEEEHFYTCQICGQRVDMRRLGDVLHHEDPQHHASPVEPSRNHNDKSSRHKAP